MFSSLCLKLLNLFYSVNDVMVLFDGVKNVFWVVELFRVLWIFGKFLMVFLSEFSCGRFSMTSSIVLYFLFCCKSLCL